VVDDPFKNMIHPTIIRHIIFTTMEEAQYATEEQDRLLAWCWSVQHDNLLRTL
jgi:hypothetical protein